MPRAQEGSDDAHSLLLMRHGETEWNREGRIQGVLDSSLTARGITQARRNGELLETLGVTHLIASPLGRAAHTARILAEILAAEISFDIRLQERDCGAWGGLTWDEARTRHPDIWQARSDDPYHFLPPGGERLSSLEPRITQLLGELRVLMTQPGFGSRYLGLVTHGLTMRVLLKCLLNPDPQLVSRIRCPNDVVYEVGISDKHPACRYYVAGEGPHAGLFLSDSMSY